MAEFIEKIFLKTNEWGKKVPWMDRAICISNWVLFVLISYFILALQDIHPFNYVLIGFVGLFSLLTLAYCFLYGRIVLDRYVILIIFFVLIQLLSTMVNCFKSFSKNGLLMGLMSIVIYEWTKRKEGEGKRLLLLATLGGLIFIIHFMIIYRGSLFSFSSRLGSYFGNENDIGRHLAITTILFILFAYNSMGVWQRVIGVLLGIMSFYLMALTGSVSNLLVTGLLLYFFLLWLLWKKNRKVSIGVGIALPILCIAFLFLPFMEYYRTRIVDMFTSIFGGSSSGDDSFNWRLNAAMYSLRMWIQNPLLGGGYGVVHNSYHTMSHNNIAEILASFGIFALIIEEIVILIPLVKDKAKTPSIFLIMGYILLFQLFLVSYNSKMEQLLIPICWSMIEVPGLKKKEKQD